MGAGFGPDGEVADVAVERIRFTYEDYCLLGDDKRYELIGGKLYVVPAPSVIHQMVAGNLYFILRQHVGENNLGVVIGAPVDVYLTEEDVVQPDVIFISRERQHIITEPNIRGAPDLVIEILSGSTAERDRTLKKKLYVTHGVREIWFVHPVARTIEVCTITPGGEKVEHYGRDDRRPFVSAVLPDLRLDLKEVF